MKWVLALAVTSLAVMLVARSRTRSVLVRPESLRIEPVTDAHFGGSIGRVQAAVFYGSLVEYEIETQEGTLVVVETDPDPDAVLPEGRLVSVDFDSAKGWVLPSGG